MKAEQKKVILLASIGMFCVSVYYYVKVIDAPTEKLITSEEEIKQDPAAARVFAESFQAYQNWFYEAHENGITAEELQTLSEENPVARALYDRSLSDVQSALANPEEISNPYAQQLYDVSTEHVKDWVSRELASEEGITASKLEALEGQNELYRAIYKQAVQFKNQEYQNAFDEGRMPGREYLPERKIAPLLFDHDQEKLSAWASESLPDGLTEEEEAELGQPGEPLFDMYESYAVGLRKTIINKFNSGVYVRNQDMRAMAEGDPVAEQFADYMIERLGSP
jgi:hypothetical protein